MLPLTGKRPLEASNTDADGTGKKLKKNYGLFHPSPFGLLDLPSDILRIIFNRQDPLLHEVGRFVCKQLWSVLPPDEKIAKVFCTEAARLGYLDALRWAYFNEAPFNAHDVRINAAANGQLELLNWVRTKAPWTTDVCQSAARAGRLDVLRWAREKGAPWDESVCEAAAAGGHLYVLMWARANGAQWNKSVCNAAAKNGHQAVLEWSRLNGAEYNDNDVCMMAIRGGTLNCCSGHAQMEPSGPMTPIGLAMNAKKLLRLGTLRY